jgi:hypothetical protein
MFGFRLRSVAQRSLEVARIGPWFDDYLRAFALCGRGDSDDVETLLEYYGVPLLLTTDEEVVALTSREAVPRRGSQASRWASGGKLRPQRNTGR